MKLIKLSFLTLFFSMALSAQISKPSDLGLKALSSSEVLIKWRDNSDSETGYKIYRDDHLIDITSQNVTSYKDTNLLPSHTYRYTIKATDDNPDNNDDAQDLQHLYKDDEIQTYINNDKKQVGIWRISDSHDLIDSGNDLSFFKDGDGLDIDYTIEKKLGGFDVSYTITNNKNHFVSLPILQIPGIKFGNINKLKVLNPLFRHYLEDRVFHNPEIEEGNYWVESGDEKVLDGIGKNSFAVANMIVKLKKKKNENDTKYREIHRPYGSQFVYSPVIVAHNNDFAVGSALEFDWRKKSDLKAYMFIEKDDSGWYYKYDLRASKIAQHDSLNMTVSVRFTKPENWIFTLYPYKDFFNKTYKTGQNRLPSLWKKSRDIRPIQTLAISSPESSTIRNSGRQFFWGLKFEDNNVTKTLHLKESLDFIGKALKAKGYKRNMLWNFTGTYHFDNTVKLQNDWKIEQQLPFQFLDNPNEKQNILLDSFAQEMRDIISDDNPTEGLKYLKDEGIGYDWGISGNIPLNKDGTTLGFDTNDFQAQGLAQFNWRDGRDANEKNKYVSEYVKRVKSLDNTIFAPKFIRLDALFRKDLADRVYWLAYLKEQFPHTTFATESSIDYIHAQSPMINQLDSTNSNDDEDWTLKDTRLEQPDLLAQYLNPTVENIVNLDDAFKAANPKEKHDYVSQLVKFGYTPMLKWIDDYVYKLEDSMVDVSNINTTIQTCMDGIDNNHDGLTDWPYDPLCKSPADSSE